PAAKPAAAALGAVVAEGSPLLARDAAEALARIGPDVRKVIVAKAKGKTIYHVLLDAIQHRDAAVRAAALEALEKMGPAEPGDAGTLGAMVFSRNTPLEIRRFAAKALEGLGADAKPAQSDLEHAFLGDPDTAVRLSAGKALASLGRECKSLVPSLSRILEEKDADLRGVALRILVGVGSDARPAFDSLTAALGDKV